MPVVVFVTRHFRIVPLFPVQHVKPPTILIVIDILRDAQFMDAKKKLLLFPVLSPASISHSNSRGTLSRRVSKKRERYTVMA